MGLGAAHRHRDRDQPAAVDARQQIAALFEQAGNIGGLDALEIVAHRRRAFRREQIGEVALHVLNTDAELEELAMSDPDIQKAKAALDQTLERAVKRTAVKVS